jgi:hypothetical protein
MSKIWLVGTASSSGEPTERDGGTNCFRKLNDCCLLGKGKARCKNNLNRSFYLGPKKAPKIIMDRIAHINTYYTISSTKFQEQKLLKQTEQSKRLDFSSVIKSYLSSLEFDE